MAKVQYLLIITLLFSLNCNYFEPTVKLSQGIEHFPGGLDPAYNLSIDAVQIYSQIYETLFVLNPNTNEVQKNLVSEWTVSDDLRSYKIKLKPDIFFQDGTEFNAYTAAFSYNRQLRIQKASPILKNIAAITAEDSLTLLVRLKEPSALFIYKMTSPLSLVAISRRALEQYGPEIKFHPVGTGPFQLEKWENEQEIVLTPNRQYHGDKKNEANIFFRYYRDKIEREHSIQDDNIDILFAVSGYSLDRLKWLGTVDYALIPPMNILYLGLNRNSYPLNLKSFRTAILKAIDIPRLVYNVNRGNAEVAKGPLPPNLLEYAGVGQAGGDTKRAKFILDSLGIPLPVTLKFFFPRPGFVRKTIVEYLESDLNKVGIELEVQEFESWEEHNAACKSDSSQLFLTGWDADVLGDPQNFLYSLFHSKSEYNVLNYENKLVDKMLEAARKEPDKNIRQEYYRRTVKLILDDMPAVFLYHVIPHFAYNKHRIHKLPVNPYGIIQYQKIILEDYKNYNGSK